MLTLILLLLLTTLAFWNFFWKRRSLPPGPTPLPFFGNTLALKNAKSLYEPFRRWTREFGPVYTFWMGEDPVVMVTGYEQMRDMFVKDGDTFAGRHFMVEFFKILTASKGMHGGVIRTEGEPWKVIRRFGLQAMRNLGVGKASLECQYLSDICALVGRLRAQLLQADGRQGDEQEMNLQPHIDRLIGSTINRLLFGYGFDEEQLGEYYELKAITGRQVQLMMTVTGKMLVTRPALRHLPVFSATFAAMDANVTEVFNFLSRPIIARVAERQKKLAPSAEEPRDLLDHFLDQMEAAQQKDPEMAKYFTLDTLPPLCFDLFLAGQETTSLTLCFLVLYLLLDQRVQAKLHAELDRLEAEKGRNGFEDQITLADRPKLPYLSAVINESQRLCNLLPINLGHRTMADVDILEGKFHLKKGTIIVPQISTVLLDEKIFPNPHRFSPERFLDEQGQLKRCEQLIPFSLGKRICMGESLARMELFLFTANFFRNFQVLPADPLNPPSAQPMAGFSVRPHPYNCRLIIREKAAAAEQ